MVISGMLRELITLLPYIRTYKIHYAVGLVFLLITNAGQMLIPQILKRVVDLLAEGRGKPEAILTLAGELIVIALSVSLARFGWRFFIQGSARRIERTLRDRFFGHLLKLHAGFFSGTKVGDLMARATNDMNAVRMASGMALVSFTDGTFMSLTILIILFYQSPKLAFLLALPLPFITVMIISVGSLVGKRFKKVQDLFSSISGLTQESVTGIRVIKSFVKEKYFLLRFGKENAAYLAANMDLAVLWGMFHPLVTFFFRPDEHSAHLFRRDCGPGRPFVPRRVRGDLQLSGNAHLADDRRGLHGEPSAAGCGLPETDQ